MAKRTARAGRKKAGGPTPRRLRGGPRNRIVGLEWVKPSDLTEHPRNWRKHPNTQRAALREALDRIGLADALLAYRSAAGKLVMIDGHLRREEMGGIEALPVLVLDLNDKEADALLASHDPIAAMAQRADALFEDLLGDVEKAEGFAGLARMLDADGPGIGGPDAEVAELFGRNEQGPATFQIVPVYDEGYDAVIIASANEQEWAQLQTILDLPGLRDRKGRVGTCHVLTARDFLAKVAKWQSKS